MFFARFAPTIGSPSHLEEKGEEGVIQLDKFPFASSSSSVLEK